MLIRLAMLFILLLGFAGPAAAAGTKSFPVCGEARRGDCVVDGDTFWLRHEKIRIVNIDTPELQARCPAERALAERARDRLAALLDVGRPRLRRFGRDQYGRTLAGVRVGDRDVGAVLIGEGLARRWDGRRHPWCG